MAKRLDALTVREVNGKSYFTRLGVAFENKNGDGWNLLLDAMPAPTDGQYKIMLKPPQDKPSGDAPRGNRQNREDSDDIPW